MGLVWVFSLMMAWLTSLTCLCASYLYLYIYLRIYIFTALNLSIHFLTLIQDQDPCRASLSKDAQTSHSPVTFSCLNTEAFPGQPRDVIIQHVFGLLFNFRILCLLHLPWASENACIKISVIPKHLCTFIISIVLIVWYKIHSGPNSSSATNTFKHNFTQFSEITNSFTHKHNVLNVNVPGKNTGRWRLSAHSQRCVSEMTV